MTSTPIPLRSRLTAADAVRDTLVVTRRNLVRNVRIPQLLLIATVQPVMFLLLLSFVFGGAIGRTLPAGVDSYTTYLIPGLLTQIAAFRAPQTAVGLTEDLSKGASDRFRALPMSRSAVLAGRTLADLVRNAFVYSLMLGDAALPAGVSLAGQLTLALVWIAGLTAVFSMFTVRAYRRVVS